MVCVVVGLCDQHRLSACRADPAATQKGAEAFDAVEGPALLMRAVATAPPAGPGPAGSDCSVTALCAAPSRMARPGSAAARLRRAAGGRDGADATAGPLESCPATGPGSALPRPHMPARAQDACEHAPLRIADGSARWCDAGAGRHSARPASALPRLPGRPRHAPREAPRPGTAGAHNTGRAVGAGLSTQGRQAPEPHAAVLGCPAAAHTRRTGGSSTPRRAGAGGGRGAASNDGVAGGPGRARALQRAGGGAVAAARAAASRHDLVDGCQCLPGVALFPAQWSCNDALRM